MSTLATFHLVDLPIVPLYLLCHFSNPCPLLSLSLSSSFCLSLPLFICLPPFSLPVSLSLLTLSLSPSPHFFFLFSLPPTFLSPPLSFPSHLSPSLCLFSKIHRQFPLSFEFNDFFLRTIAYHHCSMRFHTFTLDCEKERCTRNWLPYR